MIVRPMLAAVVTNEGLDNLRYPLLASPKLDGIRIFIHPTLGAVTRKLKPVPNYWIHNCLASEDYHGIDGEIMVRGLAHDEEWARGEGYKWEGDYLPFGQVQSAVMSRSGSPIFDVLAFDYLGIGVESLETPFECRYETMRERFKDDYRIKPLRHSHMLSATDARNFAAWCISEGYEGMILRDPLGPYKQNRSTLKQQYMLKFKEFKDAEGIVIGFEELQHNDNVQERDELGLAKRSDKKEGMVPGNTLGALVLSTSWGELRVGTGFDAALRKELWDHQESYVGKKVTFKYQMHGMQDLPRFPVFLHFRED